MPKKLEWNSRYIAVSGDDKLTNATKFLALQDYAVYVTLSIDCEDMVNSLKKKKVNIQKISFISIGKPNQKLHCYAASSAHSLAEIAMLAKDLLDSSGSRKKAIVIDSLKDIISANNTSAAEEFIEFIGKSCVEWSSGLMVICDKKIKNRYLFSSLTHIF